MHGGGAGGSTRLSSGATAVIVAVGLLVGGATSAVSAVVATGSAAVALGWDEGTTTRADAAPAPSEDVSPAVAAPSTSPSAEPSPTPTPTTTSTPRPTPTPTPTPAAKPTSRPTAKPAAAAAATGLVLVTSVVDGDTLKVRLGGVTERIRVIGIDTPELRGGECYAQQASSRMQSLVQSKKVRLVRDRTQDDRDRYGRLLRHVQLADGRQVAKLLIAGGFGDEYTYDRAYAGQAAYRAAENAARKAGKGIWSSGCLAPPSAAPGKCVIKGNIASDGEKIYHLPGQQFYTVTKITESKGERWFCSESDAVAAGWRKSKR